jgi:hypothetical protein
VAHEEPKMTTTTTDARGALTRAFARLRKAGITTSTGLCCGSCAAHACGTRMNEREELKGYAYASRQDLPGLEEGDGCYVGFGGRGGSDEAATPIGAAVVDALAAEGLASEWDGTAATRVWVKGGAR